ncbi:MAG TPA: hypothetical protein VG205_13160 [Acidimicrobiales bacterium]|nr:hypothetical protein [Acidimicrobiales bacterium]
MTARGTGRPGGAGPVGQTVPRSPRITPFWILQAAEILSLLALADLSLHVDRGGVLAVSGGVFAALALTTDGPLGLIRIAGRKLHVLLVVVAAVLVALSPIVSPLRSDIEGILILEVAAIGIIRLATLVNTDPRPARPRGPRGSRRVVEASATASPATASPATASPAIAPTAPPRASTRPERSPSPSPSASIRRTLLPSPESVGAAARWAGRATGAATSAASRTTAKHGPTAKAQAKRSIRSAGRLVGRATRPEDPTSSSD